MNSISEAAFPDFFIVGAPKCGTTTLYDWLSQHDSVFMPRKELCFFSQDIFPTAELSGHIPDLEAYCGLFSGSFAVGKSKGDATPKYLHSDLALREIRCLSKRPRIIVCVRDPVDLAVSLHSQKVREGWERETDFAKAWLRELAETTPETARSRPGDLNYVFWAHLGARLDRLFALFERDQVLVVHLRELRDAPRAVYVKILDFLSLPDDGRSDFGVSNPRSGLASPLVNRLALQVYRLADPVLDPLRRLRGGRGFGILKTVNRFNRVKSAYVSEVSDVTRRQLYAFLADDIALAERYLDERKLTDLPEQY